MLERTKKALPEVQLVICEPFFWWSGERKWFPEFDKCRAAAKKSAEAHHAVFVPSNRCSTRRSNTRRQITGPVTAYTRHGASLMAHFLLNSIQVS